MRGQPLAIAVLIGIMCVGRLAFAAVGYANPTGLMEYFGLEATNLQTQYVIRLWAIRDIVLSVLVVLSPGSTIKALLWACIVVDATDFLSTQISRTDGLFNAASTWSLTLAVFAALVPEIAALALIYRRRLSPTAEI